MLSIWYQALPVYDGELFDILFAVKKWYQYLVGRHFKIRPDHQPLKFFVELKIVYTKPAYMVNKVEAI